jgi:hypothetical protein
MTIDDIIRVAREAGFDLTMFEFSLGFVTHGTHEEFERFAALVAAAEREAIAQMIEDSPPLVSFAQNEMGGCLTCGFTPKLAALTIRERGKP